MPAAAVLGLVLAVAFPEPGFAPSAFVAMGGLLFLLDGAGAKRGFLIGLTFGITFFGLLIYWISIIGVVAFGLLVLLQALFLGGFGASWGAASLASNAPAFKIVTPAALWVGFEYLRSVFPLRGFTWGQLAQSQHDVAYLLRFASVGGSWLLAGVMVSIGAMVILSYRSLRAGERGHAVIAAGGVAALISVPLVIPSAAAGGREVRVAVVQGNVPRHMEPSLEKQLAILRSHVHLTEELPSDVDLVVWPESAVGIDPEREPSVGREISEAARAAGAPMIVGGNLDLPNDRYRVVTFLVSEDGAFVDRYQKTHLVPFGEYVPARRFLDWIPALDQVPRDAVPASENVIFDLPDGPVAPVISFEGDFGSLVRGRIAAGGRLLVVATNTSTWEESWASAQHVAMSQVRAAENGVYVAHAALSGISAIIEPDGSVIERTPLWEPSVLIHDVRMAENVTPYARFGDVIAYGAILWSCVAIFMIFRRRPVGNVS